MKHILTVALTALFAATASAQMDISSKLAATTIAGSTTNAGPGNGVIGWNIDQTAVVQSTIVTTNNGAGLTNTVTFNFDTSDNGTDWVASSYSAAVYMNKSTNSTAINLLTNTAGGKWLRPGTIENPNSNAATVVRFSISLKED